MNLGKSNTELFITPQQELDYHVDRLKRTDGDIADNVLCVDALARARMARESDQTVVGNITGVEDLDD